MEHEELEAADAVGSEEAEISNDKPEEVSLEEQLKEALNKSAELEAKLADAENRYIRLQADFDNSRRRARLDIEASEKYRAQKLISDLLPAIDNFERALQMETDSEQVKSVLQGMEMVYRSLLEALKNEGAEQIESVGKEFDPHIHQAVMQVEVEGFESNTVVEEFQKGYILKDRVIRPAMVKVNQ
ncbi:nucleotide exchange factor GrpE [Cytobacillus dafuensis]|uniref:Protein GrpE n=1 Tax=Cytobacillus dafuensis TaxID=1742359 RepID=A0A5B8ZB22_CYTDA|nr:nucleotide exchange factor GrpE [Cytobacillus dafuensis]